MGPVAPAEPPVKRSFLGDLAHASVADRIDDVGAMMAYYVVLAMFPMLLCVVTLALLVLPESVLNEGVAFSMRALPYSARAAVNDQIGVLVSNARAEFAIGTIAFALWGASRGASAMMGALNALFGVTETRGWFRRQGIAIAATVGLALLLVVALALLVLGPTVGHFVADRFGLGAAFDVGWQIARWAGAGILVMLVWSLALYILPNRREPFRLFTVGAFVFVVLSPCVSVVAAST